MTDCQFLRILVDNKQKDTKHNSQNARKYHCINKKHLPLKRKLLSKKHPVYSHNEV